MLYPGNLVFETLRRPVGLDINRLHDARFRNIGEILADRIVAPDGLIRAENAGQHRPGQPRQITLAPDMVMGINDGDHGREPIRKV